jgi:DNA-directed RNA polymerase specialized sigma24 family protein
METDIQILALNDVVARCAQETEAFFRRIASDSRYCYELFRRALHQRERPAFDAMATQYQRLVASWVQRHPAFPTAGEDLDYFANRAFEKLWFAVTPAKFNRFPDLKSLLRYLQMCVHSAIVDHLRQAEQATLLVPENDDESGDDRYEPGADDPELARPEREEMWRAVDSRLRNDQERLVLHGCFALGMKPSDLCEQYPAVFPDVRDAYRVKANLLERLRRDAELRELLGGHG